MFRTPRLVIITAVILGWALGLGGCAHQPTTVALPYEAPVVGGTDHGSRPIGLLTGVKDARPDWSVDSFLKEPVADFTRRMLAAELVASGAFANVQEKPGDVSGGIQIEASLGELSWMVPNHSRMVKTAFWTSFLTGGLGGLAYGATETPVFGHASLHLKLTDRTTSKVLLDRSFDAVHEERIAKLKSDTIETRTRVMGAALKATLVKAAKAAAAANLTEPDSATH